MAKKKSKTIGSRKVTTVRLVRVKVAKTRAVSVVPLARDRNGVGARAEKAPAEARKYILGSSSIFTPEVMNDIHIKSELGRYRMRGFSLFKKFHIGTI